MTSGTFNIMDFDHKHLITSDGLDFILYPVLNPFINKIVVNATL